MSVDAMAMRQALDRFIEATPQVTTEMYANLAELAAGTDHPRDSFLAMTNYLRTVVGDNAPPAAPLVKLADRWPKLAAEAYHGPVGEFVLDADPYTEADPVAVLVTSLVLLGTVMGRGPHAKAGNDKHPARLFAVMVGDTAKARKGTSDAVAERLIEQVDPWFSKRILGGFGSGEAMIDEVADGRGIDGQGNRPDDRLLILETEFARVLTVADHKESILSQNIRAAWDGRRLEARSRLKLAVASSHHIGMVGHITVEELAVKLGKTEAYAGFVNRILWCCVRRSKTLSDGGNVPDHIFDSFGALLAERVDKGRAAGLMTRTDAGEVRWAELYDVMSDDTPVGLLGAAISRDTAQCLRLSVLYALLDGTRKVDVCHIDAAWALWSFCRDSAAMLFGKGVGNSIADRLLVGVLAAGAAGLDGTQQHNLFGRNVKAEELGEARDHLLRLGLVRIEKVSTGGRRKAVLVAADVHPAENGRHPSP